jgi:hypothetical protein
MVEDMAGIPRLFCKGREFRGAARSETRREGDEEKLKMKMDGLMMRN